MLYISDMILDNTKDPKYNVMPYFGNIWNQKRGNNYFELIKKM